MNSSDDLPTEDLLDLYENAPCGYASLSPDSRIVKINRRLANWLGAKADSLVGRRLHDVLSFGSRIAFETHLAPLLRLQGSVNEIALDILHSDGSSIPVIANAAEKRAADGHHLFTRLTVFKAVDRRMYERELVEARDRAEAAAAVEHETATLREQFIAVLGHDLRNPLAALAAGVRMLAEREELTNRGQLVVKEMGASTARASALVTNVLDLARGRLGGGLPLEIESSDAVGSLLEHVIFEMRVIAPDRQIISEFEISEPVTCDPGRLGQLASNLVANALTHGAPGVPVEVEARTADGVFVFSVTNGGVPIAPAAREHLFHPFFRGDVRPSQQGLGLGLFIVSEIAKAHQGTIDVISNDQLTRFTFSMPLQPPKPPGV